MKILSCILLALFLAFSIQLGEHFLKFNTYQFVGLSLFAAVIMFTASFARHRATADFSNTCQINSTATKFKKILPLLLLLSIGLLALSFPAFSQFTDLKDPVSPTAGGHHLSVFYSNGWLWFFWN